MPRVVWLAALIASLAASPFQAARATNSLTITYFTIGSSDPDANRLVGGVFTNEVQNGLGANGLPVLNLPMFGCTANCYAVAGAPGFPSGGTVPNVNVTAAGEITYWSPTLNPYVTQTSQATTTLPFDMPYNFFPPNGTGTFDGGTAGYQGVHLSGTISAPSTETLGFTIGSDDMSFAYIDGTVVCDDGGVHASSSVMCTTPTIAAGTHSFDLFFVDMNQVQSGLSFDIATSGVSTGPGTGSGSGPGGTSMPEPASLLLLAGALAAVSLRKKSAKVA